MISNSCRTFCVINFSQISLRTKLSLANTYSISGRSLLQLKYIAHHLCDHQKIHIDTRALEKN